LWLVAGLVKPLVPRMTVFHGPVACAQRAELLLAGLLNMQVDQKALTMAFTALLCVDQNDHMQGEKSEGI
jgi:hypothetical protein